MISDNEMIVMKFFVWSNNIGGILGCFCLLTFAGFLGGICFIFFLFWDFWALLFLFSVFPDNVITIFPVAQCFLLCLLKFGNCFYFIFSEFFQIVFMNVMCETFVLLERQCTVTLLLR